LEARPSDVELLDRLMFHSPGTSTLRIRQIPSVEAAMQHTKYEASHELSHREVCIINKGSTP
jgi:hypothetical protein